MTSLAAFESIERILNKNVRPVLREHGGNVRVLSFRGGALKMRMEGNCSNCPSAVTEVEQLVAAEVRKAVPEVESVLLVAGVSDELLEMGRKLMRNRGSEDRGTID